MSDSSTTGQDEHELISTSLEVEQLDNNLFRSKSPLWLPARSKGAFGGQVISQAIVSATNCIEPSYGLHSLHPPSAICLSFCKYIESGNKCYFLLRASSSIPILYDVDRLRNGRSYSTCAVRARQGGKTVFIMLCSFHRAEPEHPSHQWHMPVGLPNPDDMELDITFFRRWQSSSNTDEKTRDALEQVIQERSKSPICQTVQIEREAPNGALVIMFYMKAKGVPKYSPMFQKAILGYMSDLGFINVANRTLGLKLFSKGPNALGMNASLDHAIFYYSNAIDCSDWILHVMQSPCTGSGRGVVQGQMYSQDGHLIAITTQEGVVRADIPRPDRSPRAKPKL